MHLPQLSQILLTSRSQILHSPHSIQILSDKTHFLNIHTSQARNNQKNRCVTPYNYEDSKIYPFIAKRLYDANFNVIKRPEI